MAAVPDCPQPACRIGGGTACRSFSWIIRRNGLGNKNTWLFTAQAGGFFRTTDAGASWTQV